jgi:hypothetical protein
MLQFLQIISFLGNVSVICLFFLKEIISVICFNMVIIHISSVYVRIKETLYGN